MCALQNGFHHEKGHILFLKLGISTLGHQIPRLVTGFVGVLVHGLKELDYMCLCAGADVKHQVY